MRVLVLAAMVALPALAQKAKAFPWPMTVSKLSNGLTVVRVPFESPGIVAFDTVVRVGSRFELEPGHSGFAHFFEHMMFRGTKRFPGGARSALIGKLGFAENAFTSDDMTVYTVSGPSAHLETLIDVEADRFRNLEYEEEPFKTEAGAVHGEYKKNASDPGLKIEESLRAAAFKLHPYQHTTLGYLDDIKAMPTRYDYSKQFFRRWYTPDNCIVIVVGDFDDAVVMKHVSEKYGPWKGKRAPFAIPSELALKGPVAVKVSWASQTLPRTGFFFRTPATTMTSKDGAIMAVLADYLAGPTSPLFKSMVLERQLVEHLTPTFEDHVDPFLFGIDARLKNERDRAEVNNAIRSAIEAAGSSVDEKRLQDIRDHARFALPMQLQTPADIAETLAVNIAVLGHPDGLEYRQKQIAAVTANDVKTFVKKHLVEKNQLVLEFTVDVKESH